MEKIEENNPTGYWCWKGKHWVNKEDLTPSQQKRDRGVVCKTCMKGYGEELKKRKKDDPYREFGKII